MLLQRAASFEFAAVPYRGGAPLLADMLAGVIPVSFNVLGEVLPHIQSGKLRSLGICSAQRSAFVPEIPTLVEQGYPEIALQEWLGWFLPAKTPDAIVQSLSELLRGGLQALPKGQVEAAQALGLTYWQTTRKIVLPQALRLVIPAIVNSFISVFKDTSLVTIVSLYDLTGALQLALGDADWRKFFLEGQLFVAAVYFVCCFALSRYSRWVESYLNTGMRRQ